jgi:putative membrane-bound dehydrogenase-like protein
VKVLFLGDTGHHQPVERARDVYSLLGRHGVDLTYTQDLADLNPDTLSRYDVLLLYANWTKIEPDQEKALIAFVESGHGLATIHCGSYCFLNSPKITAMIGGRFKSHSTATFKETIARPDSVIEQGLKPIESWDETYVHEMHNEKDREVLSYRVEGDRKEPYTWTRTQGKGRVFYTAWGHDQRTWTNADFDALLERGIRWSAGDWALAPQPKLKAFTYVEAKIPNYVAGAKWGTTGEPLNQMQEPVSAEESMKHMVVAPGFQVKLVTSEPNVKKPICMAFDERGRLWVAETFDYPNNMQREGDGHDQITICEDTDGDGVADKFTVFADKLSIPTSIVFANGGVIVAQAPDILFLIDTTGTGHADVRKVLYHGWGTRDTHAGPSNLRYGFDNWIYGTVGYSGFNGTVNGERVQFGQGVFRMKPDGSKLEFLGSTTNNTWGLGFTEDGQVIGSTANGNPAWYLHIPNRYFESVSGWPATRLEPIADSYHFYPVTDKVRQVDWFGGYTAGAGSAPYTARSFPKSYWNRVAFVSEPTGHLVGQFVYERKGSDFTAVDDFNLLASDDEWTSPIAAEVGPDGAVWFIDWYNYIIQHNPIPRGWQTGKGGAYETPLRDKRHGRVYRMIWSAGKPSRSFDLAGASNQKLIEALKSDNMLWRMHAQRLLVEHGDKSVLPALAKLVEDKSVDPLGMNPAAIHALWAISGISGGAESGPVATAALHHPVAGVRKAAVDTLPRTAESVRAILSAKVLDDPDPQVRKSTLLALSEMPGSNEAGAAVYAALQKPENVKDRWIPDATAVAASHHDEGFLRAAFAAHPRRDVNTSLAAAESTLNLLPNPSFDDLDATPAVPMPLGWRKRTYGGQAVVSADEPGHTGAHSLKITSENGADASANVTVRVEPDTQYRLSGWIKTKGLEPLTGKGALLNVDQFQEPRVATPSLHGPNEWTHVEVEFNSGAHRTLTIDCLFGGWGTAKGTAWFDDVQLSKVMMGGLPAGEGRVIGVVVNQYARRAPSDSIMSVLDAVSKADPSLASVVLDSLARSWPSGKAPQLSEADVKQMSTLMTALPSRAQDALLALIVRWDKRQMFASQAAGVITSLRKSLEDKSADGTARVDAARHLISIDDSSPTAELVLKQILATEPPDVQIGLLDAVGQSRDAGLGASLVGHYGQLAPSAQRELLNIMIRRKRWTGALLDGIKSGQINNRDLLPQQWSTLAANPDEKIASRAEQLRSATGHAPTADRKAIVDKFISVAEKPGDVARGKLVFETTCAICHTIEGKGGKVGPDLTGIGAKPRAELLHKVLDPNSSVEGTYRQWVVRTRDGDTIAGRIFAENRTSLQLYDATAKLHEVQRSDIDRLVATSKTLMPEGFEQLGEEKLADLLTFLATTKVKR